MKKAIYWFRKNLRINDIPSLHNAINENDEVICIYIKNYSIYNPPGIDLGDMGSFRKKFLDESVLDLKNNLSDQEAIDFQIQFQKKKKSVLTAVLLAIFFGAYGGHKFYLGQIKSGFIYLAFFWTLIPLLIALYEVINMGKIISNQNYKIALDISKKLKS